MSCRASQLIGCAVRSAEGGEVGTIEELVLDPITGRVAFAVIEPSNRLDRERGLFPVPWAALSFDPHTGACVIDVPRRTLARAPTVTADELTDVSSRPRGVEIFAFYGYQPFWERSA